MTDGSRSGGPSAEWTYDGADRVLTYKQHSVDRIINYGYNVEGGRTSMSVERISVPGSPWATSYTYDATGRLDTLTDSRVGSGQFDYAWDPKGNLVTEILMPSGAKQMKIYDALARLGEIRSLDSSGVSISRYTYTHDAASLRKDVTLADNGKISYVYDPKRQLTGAVKDNEAAYSYSYTYDNIGNWLTGKTGQIGASPLSKTFIPNNLNQYGQVSSVTQVHDANGSITGDGTRTFVYDQENRLTAVAGASFAYDGMSRRVASGTTRYLYDGLLPIAELDSGNNYTRTVTRGLDQASGLQSAGGVGGILATVSASVTGYYFYDGSGNVVDVLDVSNAVVAHYAYDPFGNKVGESGSYASQPYQWSTKEFDSTSGLVYYLYRFYNPKTGRWLTRDPIEEKGGANLYAFTENNTPNWHDYLGHVKQSVDISWQDPGDPGVPGYPGYGGIAPRPPALRKGKLEADASASCNPRVSGVMISNWVFVYDSFFGNSVTIGLPNLKFLRAGVTETFYAESYQLDVNVDNGKCCVETRNYKVDIHNHTVAKFGVAVPGTPWKLEIGPDEDVVVATFNISIVFKCCDNVLTISSQQN